MEIKPAGPAKGEVKINAEHAKKKKASIFKKAKIAVAGLMLSAATMVHGCEGEMDLSPYARTQEDAVEVRTDAGVVRDGGIPGFDVPYEDAKDGGAALDSGATQDTGPSCTSPNDSRVLLKLSIGGEQQVVEEGSKVKIGNKEYSVSLSANTGDLVLTSDTGEVEVVPRGKTGVVNGTGVKLVDQAADKLYFTSRALVSVSAGSDSSRAILGEKGTAVLNVGEFGVKLTSKGIEPWDNEGSVLVADLVITTPEYTITKEGVRIGKEGYKVVIGAEELSIAPVEFGNDLYQSANAPADLCTKTEVKITLVADGRRVVLDESSVYKIGNGTLRLGLAFVGSAHQVVELAVVADGKELVKGIYRPGDDFTFSDGVSLHNVGIEKVDFVTKEAK